MKKAVKIIALALALTLIAFTFISCKSEKPEDNTPYRVSSDVIKVGNQSSGKVMKLVVGGENEKVYSVDFSGIEITEGPLSVIKHLAEAGKLTYKIEGTFLTEVGDLKQDAATGTYIFLWTSVEADFDVSEWATTKEWSGKTLTSSGIGIQDMTVENGAVIYVGTVSWGS